MINFVNGRAGAVELFKLTVAPSVRQHALGSAYHQIASVMGGKLLWSYTTDTFCHCICLVTEFNRLSCRLQLVNLLPHCIAVLFLQYGITNWYLTWDSHWWTTL